MTPSPLVLVANAKDETISVFALAGDSFVPLHTHHLPGSCSTFAIDAERNLVYAGVKGDPPGILTLSLDRSHGTLKPIARRDVHGALTYLSLTGGGSLLLGASYAEGVGSVWPVEEGKLGRPVTRVQYPNLHCVIATADGRNVYFVSLGADLIAQYRLSDGGGLTALDPPEVHTVPGSGPRHLILDAAERNAYLITEFSGEVIRLTRDKDGRLSPAESVSIVDPAAGLRHSRYGADPRAEHLIWGADLHLAAGERFLLASERTASTLATVTLDADGTLGQVVALRRTEPQPRGFTVMSAGTRVLVVGELATNVALYSLRADGFLADVAHADTGRGANWVRVVGG